MRSGLWADQAFLPIAGGLFFLPPASNLSAPTVGISLGGLF